MTARVRNIKVYPQFGGQICQGQAAEMKVCNNQTCPSMKNINYLQCKIQLHSSNSLNAIYTNGTRNSFHVFIIRGLPMGTVRSVLCLQ